MGNSIEVNNKHVCVKIYDSVYSQIISYQVLFIMLMKRPPELPKWSGGQRMQLTIKSQTRLGRAKSTVECFLQVILKNDPAYSTPKTNKNI